MSAAERPWWASGQDRTDPSEDPLQRHRAARRGGEGDPTARSGDAGRVEDPITDDGTSDRTAREGDRAGAHDPDVCGVCPWCATMRHLQASHPEVVGHLTEAARHLTAAFRDVLSDLTAAPATSADGTGSDDGAAFEHIDLD